MRVFLLTSLTMVAFAANSILNRLALAEGEIGPSGFAAIRVAAGVVVLLLLLVARDHRFPRFVWPNLPAVVGLSAYMLGFSYAYVSMDAGLGALILFGGVQVTMFIGALFGGEKPPAQRWVGMALAMAGLAILTFPSGPTSFAISALLMMGCAAIGWGIYSLVGRGVADPVFSTGWNFIYTLPIVGLAFALWPDATLPSTTGIVLAITSGGVTSALGYALWYSLLPALGATIGAIAQLSAPAIALGLGAFLLGETVTATAILAAAMILGGIAVGLAPVGRR